MLRTIRVWLSSALLNLSVWIGPPARLPSSSPTPRVRPPPATLPGGFEDREAELLRARKLLARSSGQPHPAGEQPPEPGMVWRPNPYLPQGGFWGYPFRGSPRSSSGTS